MAEEQKRKAYDTDLTDKEWAEIKPLYLVGFRVQVAPASP